MNGYNIKSLLIAVIMMIVSSTVLYSADPIPTPPPDPQDDGVVSCKILKPVTVKFEPDATERHEIVVVKAGSTVESNGVELAQFSMEVTGSANEEIELQVTCSESMTVRTEDGKIIHTCSNTEGVTMEVWMRDVSMGKFINSTSHLINDSDGRWSGNVCVKKVTATANATLGVHYFTFTATANYTCL